MKLTDREWKEFNIDSVFNVSGTITTKPQNLQLGGKTPRITCAATNNGLDDLYMNKPTEKGKVITIDSATTGFTSYQGYDFIATDHVEKINLKDTKMNVYTGLFFKQVIDNAIMQKYNYGYKFSQTRIKKQKILLPITAEGQPDYQFMEDYIKEIMYRKRKLYLEYAQEKLQTLPPPDNNLIPLQTKEWKEFKIESLFNIEKVKGLPFENYKLGTIPYISTSSINNGLTSFVYADNKAISKSNSISVDPIKGKSFYHPYNFVGRGFSGASINLLSSPNLCKEIALFLCNSIEKTATLKASYGYLFNSERLRKGIIILPITEKAQPDYTYMENYIKNIFAKKYNEYVRYAQAKL